MYTYGFGTFTIHTELELPELQPSTEDRFPLFFRRGEVPLRLQQPVYEDEFCSVSADQFLLQIPDIANFAVRNGREITVDSHPSADPLDVRGFLLGNVFAIACHQRRLIPLHASAVLMGGGVVAFLGASGAGKSTLAAFLARAGYPLVADDICLLDPRAEAAVRVLPIPPWLKLWRGSLSALGHSPEHLPRTFTDEDKYKLPVHHFPAVNGTPLRLKALVFLERTEAGSMRMTRLNAAQAIAGMMKFTYQSFIPDWLGLQTEHFAGCAASLGEAPVYRCERPWGFDALPVLLSSLERNFCQPT